MYTLIANFKQNKTIDESIDWLKNVDFKKLRSSSNVRIVVAPAHPLLYPMKVYIQENLKELYNTRLFLGAQDISMFDSGSHTGDVGIDQLKDLVDYVIVGHLERRQRFDDEFVVNNKLKLAIKGGFTPIVCFSDFEEFEFTEIKAESILFSFEPRLSVGTGNTASVEEIASVIAGTQLKTMLYGGSVDLYAISKFVKIEGLKGFLIGTNSLVPRDFEDIMNELVDRVG